MSDTAQIAELFSRGKLLKKTNMECRNEMKKRVFLDNSMAGILSHCLWIDIQLNVFGVHNKHLLFSQ